MNFIYKFVILIFAVAVCSGCKSMKEKVDLIITNAVIYTVDEDFSIANSIVVHEGKVVATGEKNDLIKLYKAKKHIDASGFFIYPGFYDPHCHFYGYGLGLVTRADLTGLNSFQAVVDTMIAFSLVKTSGWLVGRGWDQNLWESKEYPDNEILNDVFPNRPVMLIRVDGHAVLANDKALKLAGIDANYSVHGGEVLLKNGKPTGILIDKAADILKYLFEDEMSGNRNNEDIITDGILKAQKNCFAVGITTVADAGLDYNAVKLLLGLQENDDLLMNVYAMLNYTPENIENFISKGIFRTGRMHIRSVKFFADGALGSRGALLLEPYNDRPGHHGILTIDPDNFKKNCKEIFDYGYQVNTHAIGDSANRFVLETYATVLKEKNDLRWRIEHAQVVHPDDLELFRKYSVIPAINAIHATSDMYWAQDRLGKYRIKHAYAYKDLLNTNGWICNGSDFPVEPINPLLGFFAAIQRTDLDGLPKGGFLPENRLSRKQALKAMTIWSAKACFEEYEKGSLEPGKTADMVFLDTDLMNVETVKIPEAKVMSTWVNGVKVFDVKDQ